MISRGIYADSTQVDTNILPLVSVNPVKIFTVHLVDGRHIIVVADDDRMVSTKSAYVIQVRTNNILFVTTIDVDKIVYLVLWQIYLEGCQRQSRR